MGQIVSSAAKPKRCNANQLSQVPTPAAGEHILVSSGNSMNAAGQGDFDCYIVGDGTTAATALELHKFKGEELEDRLYGSLTENDVIDETYDGSSSSAIHLISITSLPTEKTYQIRVTLLASASRVRVMTRSNGTTNVRTLYDVSKAYAAGDVIEISDFVRASNENNLVVHNGSKGVNSRTQVYEYVRTTGELDSINASMAEIDGKVGILDEEMNGEKSEVSGYSLFTIPAYIRTNGTDTNPASQWMRTDFIDLDKFVSCKVWLHSSVASIAFYSAKDLSTFLGYAGSGTYGTEGTFNKADLTIPAGTKYVIVSTENLGTTRPYTASSVTTIEVTTAGLTQRVEALEDGQGVTAKNKGFAHISFDDVVFCLHDITQNADTYTSIFDNDFFALLKTLHDTYGAVFSLFVFLEDATTGDYATGWTLANTTTKFASEFAANADWLKFGLHALNKGNNYAARSVENCISDYSTFVSAIMSITGTTESIDRLPRLGNFAGGLTQMQTLRDCDAGIIGALAAYDDRDSYYLTSGESALAFNKGVLVDATNHLVFYTSLKNLEGSAPSTLFNAKNTPATMGRFFNLEWMMHEYAIGGQDYGYSSYDWNTMAQRLESACQISMNNGYTWEYPFVAALKAGL